MLKESKIDLIEYKFWRTENKYIIIPTYNEFIGEGKISLLQEHEIGTDKYILSVGSPSKSYKLVPLFNH